MKIKKSKIFDISRGNAHIASSSKGRQGVKSVLTSLYSSSIILITAGAVFALFFVVSTVHIKAEFAVLFFFYLVFYSVVPFK